MEFTKIRVRNLPTEEEYIQEKDKEYQVLKKLSKIPLISNGIGALLAFIAISVAIAKLSYFDVGEFMMTMVVGGGMIFLFCKWAFEDVRKYKDRKKKYELFQLYLSFDTETETKFVQSDTEVCGKFTGLYFIRMLKEDPHPHVWCNLWSETAAELWFKYKEKIFIVPIAVKGIHDDAITEEECVYDFNPKENGIIYYRQRKPEKSSNSRAEIVIETDDNWGDAKGTGHTCGACVKFGHAKKNCMIELTEDSGYKWLNPTEKELAELSHMLGLNTSEKEKELNNLAVKEAFLELVGERLSFEEVARYTCNELVIRYLLSQDKEYAKDALKNPECPEWLFENVVNCPDVYDSSFRYVAVHAAKCPKVLLEKMLDDENNGVKNAAKKRLRNMDGKQDFANWLFRGSLGEVIIFLMVVLSTIGVLCISFQDAAPSGVQFFILAVFGLSLILMYFKTVFSYESERLTGIYW